MRASFIYTVFFIALFFFKPFSLAAEGNNMRDPIVMGNYSGGSFSYNDSRSNIGYGNDYSDAGSAYHGQQSEDIFYRFTVNGTTDVAISTCASNFDTYIHLLKNDGSPLEHNDDNGPLCVGSRASIKTTLAAGTYYLVLEGYGSGSGIITTSIELVVQASMANVIYDSRNYTRSWEAMSPQGEEGGLLSGPLRAVRITTTYYDGLGRPEQVVARQGSLATAGGTSSDLVSPVVYDGYGRERDRYLPYAAVGSADGLFRTAALAAQNSFYHSAMGPVAGQGEEYFFSRTLQEPPPLARVTGTLAPGNSWVGAGRGIAASYQVNALDDSVRRWTVTEVAGGFGSLASGTGYEAGSLFKKVTTDEAGHQVVEYQDKQGKVVLKKVQEANPAAAGHSGWLCTYYLYDDLERLRAVLQPAAVRAMAVDGSWVVDPVALNELCFRYEYDARSRMVIKKVPGAGAVYLVHDSRDRVVMTQDANMRKQSPGSWLVTTYDALNRPLTTGMLTTGGDLAYHLGQALNSDHYPDTGTGFELLTETHYDDYTGLPGGLQNGLAGNLATFPAGPAGGSPEYAEPLAASSHTKGLVTWSRVKVLGKGQTLSTVIIYDDKGRVIQAQAGNLTGGIDITTSQYDFAGKVLRTRLEHHKPGAADLDLATRNSYDDLGRIAAIEKNIAHSGWKQLAGFGYDALGALKTKKIAPGYNNGQGLETLSYDYNIRGWLLGINRQYLQDKGSAGYDGRFFGFELGYDKPSAGMDGGGSSRPQYGGNIAAMRWKSAGDEARRRYDFTYDGANRFGRADFTQATDPSTDGPYTTTAANFSVHGFDADNDHLVKYDANGNLLSMVQHGIRGLTPDAVIDALHYTYAPQSNKLLQVQDDHNDKNSVLGDFKYDPATKTAVDYGYDHNGNLVTDLNRQLSGATGIDLDAGGAIRYNHLNLPELLTVAGKGQIEYTYDASGNKLAKTVHQAGKPDRTTLYLAAGIVYEQDTLQFLSQEEGRIRPLGDGTYGFDYFLKDHLGNVRMVLTDQQSQDLYRVASLEPAMLDSEKVYYRIPEAATVNKAHVPGYPGSDGYTDPNDYVQRLNGREQKVGTSIVLKVMAGDRVNIRASSWYRSNGSGTGSVQAGMEDIVASLLQGIAGIPGGKLLIQGQQQAVTAGVGSFLQQQGGSSGGDGKPASYLNWLLLDEQLHPVITNDGNNSGFQQVGEDQQLTIHQVTERPLTKNGYLYIYLSNESTAVDVFFDNLQVSHNKGPIIEETHYYPFGLTMVAISSKAHGRLSNKYKYNGIELDNDLDINVYEAFYRNLDPQTGRWWQIDPKVEGYESISPYASMYNDPMRYSDPLGDEVLTDNPPQKGTVETMVDIFMKSAEWINSNINPLTPIFESILGATYESGFTQPKSRSIALAEVGISLMPGGKIEGVAVRQLEKAIVNQEEKQILKSAEKTFARTEPKLPPLTIAKSGKIEIVHYTRSGDHGPAHLHVNGGGPKTKIGQNGKPLKGSPELTSKQKKVVDDSKQDIRKAVKQIMKWFDYSNKK